MNQQLGKIVVTTLSTGVLAMAASLVQGAAVISAGQTYTQDFNSLTTSTTDVAFNNDSTLDGWHLFLRSPSPVLEYRANNGLRSVGSFYSYGANDSTERALGILGSGPYFEIPGDLQTAGHIAFKITNTGATSIDSVAINYYGEQWRKGAFSSQDQKLALQYGFGDVFWNVDFHDVGGMDFDSLVYGTTPQALDGNTTRVGLSGGIAGLRWNPGLSLWLRWTDVVTQGNPNGLAIDDFSFTAEPAPVPLPAAAWLLISGVGGMLAIARRRRVAAA